MALGREGGFLFNDTPLENVSKPRLSTYWEGRLCLGSRRRSILSKYYDFLAYLFSFSSNENEECFGRI